MAMTGCSTHKTSMAMTWRKYDHGATIGQHISQEGIVIQDEEHELGARITLQRDGYTPFAITCGIYGWMVHTRFFSDETLAQNEYG